MKLKIKNNTSLSSKEEIYKIPKSIILYLRESYNIDSSIEILKWFLLYLKENKKINILNWYLKDINELKLSLNNLSNKKILYNENYENLLLLEFSSIIKDNIDVLLLINEYKDKFNNFNLNYKLYNNFINESLYKLKKIKDSSKDDEINIDLSDDNNLIDLSGLLTESTKKKKRIKKSYIPEHQWKDGALRFKKSNGKWGKWQYLKGEPGNKGSDGRDGGGIGKNKVLQLITESLNNLSSSGGNSFGTGPIKSTNQSSYSIGTSSYASREDHVHFHGFLTGSELHNTATLTQSGFMTSDDKIQLTLTPLSATLSTVGLFTFVEFTNYV